MINLQSAITSFAFKFLVFTNQLQTSRTFSKLKHTPTNSFPAGQSSPPMHLSMFLEVSEPRPELDWSCFVSHRLSVLNQKYDDKSVAKESQNRYSRHAKDWGWREFVPLQNLFDVELGFIVHDTVVLSAEVLILKESAEVLKHATPANLPARPYLLDATAGHKQGTVFVWKIENFPQFKEILETRKIFS